VSVAQRLAKVEAMVPLLSEEFTLTKQDLSTVVSALEVARRDLARVKLDYEQLHAVYTRKLEELALLKRRMFVAKAERPVAPTAQLVFDALFDQAKADAKEQLDLASAEDEAAREPSGDIEPPTEDAPTKPDATAEGGAPDDADGSPRGRGRRNLDESTLPVERIEIHDPELQAKGTFFRYEESRQLGWRRGGPIVVVTALAIYRMPEEELPSATKLVTSQRPREVFRRGLLTPSFAAHLLSLAASCRLHGLDPEGYLAEVLRVIAVWPADRLLELSPRDWSATRTRLDPRTFDDQVGPIDVPEPLPAPEQASA
jgi:hypothetical protein